MPAWLRLRMLLRRRRMSERLLRLRLRLRGLVPRLPQVLLRMLRRVLRPLFPGLEDETAWSAVSTNLAANLLGLGNAATPAGIEAAQRLAQLGETGLRSLAMLLALNNAGLSLLPTTVISLRAAAGSADPAGIWLPALIVSGVSTLASAGLMAIINRRRG